MARLPKRYILIEVASTEDPDKRIEFRPQDFRRNPIRFGIFGLRISFDIHYYSNTLNMTGYISIYNTDTNKWQALPRYEVIRIFADYYDTSFDTKAKPPLIFEGNIVKINEKLESTYNMLKLEVSLPSILRKSYEVISIYEEEEITLVDLLRKVCESVGISLELFKSENRRPLGLLGIQVVTPSTIEKQLEEIKFREYSYSGNPFELLKSLLTNYVASMNNLSYTLIRNQLRIYDNSIGTTRTIFNIDALHPGAVFINAGRTSSPTEILRLNKNAGMILSPEVEDLGQGRFLNDKAIKVKTIFNPELIVGGQVSIESKRLSGKYIINNIRHSCDNFDGEYISEMSMSRRSGT